MGIYLQVGTNWTVIGRSEPDMSGGISRLHTAEIEESDDRPRFIELGDDESDRVLDALGSETGRRIYERLQDEPVTPSVLAEEIDRSLQTVSYHLSNLESAGLIESVGVRYSDQGQEMTVWGPASGPVVLVDDAESARETFAKYFGAVAALGLASALVQRVAEWFVASVPTATGRVDPTNYGGQTVADGLLQSVAAAVATTPPGAVVFVLGLAVLAARWLRR